MGRRQLVLHPDRLLPADPGLRSIARELYHHVRDLPIISPHGHTDARWFAANESFSDPIALLVAPDHYLTRMLYSQGVAMEDLGVQPTGEDSVVDSRVAWRTFAAHYHLLRATPSALWFDYILAEVFGFGYRLDAQSADDAYDHISEALARPDFRPRALLDRFNVEVLATTDSPLDDLASHAQLASDGWGRRIITTFRPDPVVDPDVPAFAGNLFALAEMTGTDTQRWSGYLEALRTRRHDFRQHGAVATDHGHPSAVTADLTERECQRLLDGGWAGTMSRGEKELFRGQVLLEMARCSTEDGLVMQLHPGSFRDHNPSILQRFGRDKGADIPVHIEFTQSLKPLLDRFGNDSRLRLILFTLDETAYSRELAPLAGHYPAVWLGPPWWFLDSYEAMLRFRRTVTDTAGFANTAGFNDDTRSLLSIPARHDVARRVDCAYLAELVGTHRLDVDDAMEVATDLAYHLVRRAYRLGSEG